MSDKPCQRAKSAYLQGRGMPYQRADTYGTANAVRPGTKGIRIERPNNNYGYYEENEGMRGFRSSSCTPCKTGGEKV